MQPIANNVWQLAGFPPNYFNVYLVGDVLIDGATRWGTRRILRQLKGHPPSLVVLTHCHPDHQGAAKAVCDKFGIPLACHRDDVAAAEGRERMQPRNGWLRLGEFAWAGPRCPVGRVLEEGDDVAGFRVIHAPGHTPGHIILFRESDRVCIAGDLLANIHFLTGKPKLQEPPTFFSFDPEQNRRSILALADLKPNVVCFGHGPPLNNLKLLEAYASRLR